MKVVNWVSACLTILMISMYSIINAQNAHSTYLDFKPELMLLDSTKLKANFLHYPCYNVDKLPFFCKMEHLLSEKGGINVRFRVGDLNYVNKLEGKKN